ncbi:hypothetical protein [Nonomuraea sp. NEAU-A123]|uniref:hypothetical protein n=1 Tax=Nonomuraea sp. NEAU-A123 TaxID=2839649 RepID=UPI001BE46701|nr:hypothetical protein [Nonomuraea sp. NEAU-A123]MBT2228374.1 hypothetical protein [Nonomuraea sp. NEAU-A123]
MKPTGREQDMVEQATRRVVDNDAPLDEALTWAARLGLNTGDALRTTGTLPT